MEKQKRQAQAWRQRGIFALVSSRLPQDAPESFPDAPEEGDLDPPLPGPEEP